MPNHWHSNENEACEEIAGFLSDYQDMKTPCHFAVTKDGALIGHVGIGESDISDDIYEICYAINKENRGFGYAAEAVRAFVPWCKAAFGVDKIYASTNPENIASYKSLLNAGFSAADEKNNLYVSI